MVLPLMQAMVLGEGVFIALGACAGVDEGAGIGIGAEINVVVGDGVGEGVA